VRIFCVSPASAPKSEHKPDIERGANWVAGNLRAAGFKNIEIVPTGLHPAPSTQNLWKLPASQPFLFYGITTCSPRAARSLDLAAVRTHRAQRQSIWRGTADDKGQVHIHLKAFESLQKVTANFPSTVKVLIEGEEEVGSVSLWDFVQKNKKS